MCRVCVWVNFAVGLLPYLYEMRMRACLACPAFGVHTESRWIFQLATLPPSPSFHHATQPSQLLLLLGGVFKARALTNWKLVKPPEHCPAGEPMYCIRSHTHTHTATLTYSGTRSCWQIWAANLWHEEREREPPHTLLCRSRRARSTADRVVDILRLPEFYANWAQPHFS